MLHVLPARAATAAAEAAGYGWLILFAAAATGLYFMACLIWPLAYCRWCSGTGRHRSPTGRAFRRCGRCRGTGTRIRFGARLIARAHHNRSTTKDRARTKRLGATNPWRKNQQ